MACFNACHHSRDGVTFPGSASDGWKTPQAGVVQDWGAKTNAFVDTYAQPGLALLFGTSGL